MTSLFALSRQRMRYEQGRMQNMVLLRLMVHTSAHALQRKPHSPVGTTVFNQSARA